MSSAKPTVLLIDDDPEVFRVLSFCMGDETMVLAPARDGREALDWLGRERCDLILLDLGLPDANGFDLLCQFKADERLCHVPVVVLTGWDSVDDKVRGFELGATDYITKPFKEAELRARVRAVLRAKLLQEELRRTNQELREAKMAAETAARTKAEFLATMSHEIRTPMNGVIALTGLLLERELPADVRDMVETIRSSGESLLTIINDILDFSKLEAGKMTLENQPFDVRQCVEDAMDLLATQAAQKKLDFTYFVDEAVPETLVGDVTRVRQVLVNLIGNALKFTSAGEVGVAVQPVVPAETDAPSAAGPFLEFSVRDTGVGIPPDRMDRLFKSFSQVDASTTRHYGGTGLGLAICKRLVEVMGGRIWAESVPRQGSTFRFTLPVMQPEGAVRPSPNPAQSGLANLRLLIVDDNPTQRWILAQYARSWAMQAVSAESVAQALAWLRDGQTFDLALLDCGLLEASGMSLANDIARLSGPRPMPLVLLSMLGESKRPSPAELTGFAVTVFQPVKPACLREALLQALQGPQPRATSQPPTPKLDVTLAERQPLRILLVDDNPINLKVAGRLFKQFGYRPDLASNGREALEALERLSYDMVFMDVQMPEMDGLEATRRIRQFEQSRAVTAPGAARTIIIAMTANAMAEDREACLAAGMDDYIAKPVRLETLSAALEHWGKQVGRKSETTFTCKPPPEAPCEPAAGSAGAPRFANAAADSPVDLERMTEFAGGTLDGLRELVELYCRQTASQLAALDQAIQAGNAAEVKRLAHSCGGASATCGILSLVPPLRELERLGSESKVGETPSVFAQAQTEFARLKNFFLDHFRRQGTVPPKL